MTQMWTNPVVIEWTQRLLDSYRHWTSRDLIERIGEADVQAHRLFHSPFVVVSHGAEADPLLNYGNQVALDLWAMPWGQLVQTPSRLTAEPVNRAEREGMLAQAKSQGYFDRYRGGESDVNRPPFSCRERPHLECRGCRGQASRAGCDILAMDLADLAGC